MLLGILMTISSIGLRLTPFGVILTMLLIFCSIIGMGHIVRYFKSQNKIASLFSDESESMKELKALVFKDWEEELDNEWDQVFDEIE